MVEKREGRKEEGKKKKNKKKKEGEGEDEQVLPMAWRGLKAHLHKATKPTERLKQMIPPFANTKPMIQLKKRITPQKRTTNIRNL